ncbi:hypothetical protein [Pseudomonas ficuserectae]|uniref:hypothetical protein n=1 Tax=Pseudomonas ficuserectae TaxID=53410 RepID=UPI0006D5F55F|nr:hypothetical protein [Pseudomonas ficuserectae]
MRKSNVEKFKQFADFVRLHGCNIFVSKGGGLCTDIQEWTVQDNLSEVRIFITPETALDFTQDGMYVRYWDWLYGAVMDIRDEDIEEIIVNEKSIEIVFDGDYLTLSFYIE